MTRTSQARCALLTSELTNGSDTANTMAEPQRKRTNTVAASPGENCSVWFKKVIIRRIANFFKHSHASQWRSVDLYPFETMTKLYFGSFAFRLISRPRAIGKPTPHSTSEAAATALATPAWSESQSRCGAKLKVRLPSASVLQENDPNAVWMIAGYAN